MSSLQRKFKRSQQPAVTAPVPAAPNRLNQYTCEMCGGVITTIDRHEGVTPMFLNCRATAGCSGRSYSSMYRVDPSATPTHEWYKPTGKIRAIDRQHVEMGGLLIRRIEGA